MGIYVHGACAAVDSYIVPKLNNLGLRPQERSSLGMVRLTDRAQCMQMSSIGMCLDYDSTVMLTCKLVFPAAKAIVGVGPDTPRQLFPTTYLYKESTYKKTPAL